MRQLTHSILRPLLCRRFSRLAVPGTLSEVLQSSPNICVVAQTGSVAIAALLDTFAERSGLTHGARYVSEIEAPASVLQWVALHDAPALERLLQSNPNQQFVTLNIFERRGPIRTNPGYGISTPRLLEIILSSPRLVISFGSPLTAEQDIPESPSGRSVRRLQRRLKLDFFRNLKVVRGVPFQPIAVQQGLALSGPDYERELGIIAAKMRISTARLHRLAVREFRTIAANPIRPLYSIVSRLGNVVVARLFRNVTALGIEQFTSIAKEHTVVLVPMHRSHFDYMLVGHKMYQSNVIPPVVAAGVNLSFWPAGFLIRSLGGYFVRRDSKGNRVHALVLRRYVTYLIKRGHLQEFFIEGGRSRSGKMRAPKLGLLSMMIEAFQKGLRRDIMFVPVSITYENVVEDKAFGEENTGKSKRKESFLELLRARAIFGNRYGDVVISFGTPISLVKEIESRFGTDTLKQSESRSVIRFLARLLTLRIRAQTNVTLTALSYTALLSAGNYGLTRECLLTSIRNLARLAQVGRSLDAGLGDFSPTLQSFVGGSERGLDDLLRGAVVQRGMALNRETFFIPGSNRFTADFYKNTIFHRFFHVGVLSALQLLEEEFSPADGKIFHDWFSDDLLLSDEAIFLEELSQWCIALCGNGILVERSPGRFSFLRRDPGIFIPQLLLAPIESIVWCYDTIRSLTPAEAGADSGNPILLRDVLESAQESFKLGQYLRLTSRTEASSQSALQSAIDILAARGIITVEDPTSKTPSVRLSPDECPEMAKLRTIKESLERVG